MSDIHLLVSEHAGAVWRTIHRVLENEDDARECYQQTFFDAMQMDDNHVRHWRRVLCQIAFRRSMDVLRKRYRDCQHLSHYAIGAQQEFEPGDDLFHQELREAIRSILVSLPTSQSEAFWLRHIEQLSPDEIALQMNIQSGHVRVLVHRAIQSLRTELGQKFDPSATLREEK